MSLCIQQVFNFNMSQNNIQLVVFRHWKEWSTYCMRPSMYIGDVGVRGLHHHLVYEVVDNSIDEALAGYCDTIFVSIKEGNGIEVSDNGRGIG